MEGCFITFEGGEGAGKSTQIERLRRRLEGLGHAVLATREPGGSPKAEEIRQFILGGRAKHLGAWTEALLFAAARMDHLQHTIRPALASGQTVLCDRFMDSTKAYQGALGDADKRAIDVLERVTVESTDPDLTFILDLPVEVGMERARRRREGQGETADRFEAEDHTFHETLRQAFLKIAAAAPHRCAVINADQEPASVADAIWDTLVQRIPRLTEPARSGVHVA
jgi:dTMP kinase